MASAPNPILPDGVEVFRASGDVVCTFCHQTYYEHPRYDYAGPIGGYAVKVCDGRFLHL